MRVSDNFVEYYVLTMKFDGCCISWINRMLLCQRIPEISYSYAFSLLLFSFIVEMYKFEVPSLMVGTLDSLIVSEIELIIVAFIPQSNFITGTNDSFYVITRL